MPRPGPRPYECVRRAWHSDRHQPMRGTIIQQIFRVVHETHSAATKKNKEWLEKLPIVIFKAEEIMYSKANSETDYMNQDTLWDRLNDAINTIIRRDETSETGELLPPCVEAALNLGCVPVRASRSQRNSNPRCYLSPRLQEPTSLTPRALDKINDKCIGMTSPLQRGNIPSPSAAVNSTLAVSESSHCLSENDNVRAIRGYPLEHVNSSPMPNPSVTKEGNLQPNTCSVYPLYYGNHYQFKDSQLASQGSHKNSSDIIIVGRPVGTSVTEPAEMGFLQNFFPRSTADISPNIIQANTRNTHEKVPSSQCDLSLRLSLSSEPCTSWQSAAQETKDVGLSNSQDRGLFSKFPPEKAKELYFFPGRVTNNSFKSSSANWFCEEEVRNLDSTARHRKRPFNDNAEDRQYYCQPPFSSSQFIFRPEGPGL